MEDKTKKSDFYTDESIIKYWDQNSAFYESVYGKKSKKDYIFYDGPPFANGLPHYGHLLTGFIKDTFARYHTMLNEKVERRFGWDCHGLPAEMESEKILGVGGRLAIKEYGVDKFNDCCRTSVMKYSKEWKEYITKQARWVDFENDYKTMDLDYMESVIWAFKELYKKDMLYETARVMPYSWKCQTPLSNFEIHLDNSYRPKKSKSVYVKFELEEVPDFVKDSFQNVKKVFCVAWTTTPWTLPSNLALCVGEEIDYTMIEKGNDVYIIAESLSEDLKKKIDL